MASVSIYSPPSTAAALASSGGTNYTGYYPPAASYGKDAKKNNKVDFLVGHEWQVGVLFIILVLFMLVFEKGLHHLDHKIAHAITPQRGLKSAVKKLKDELLVTGFLSLVLTALQGPLHTICIGTKSKPDKSAGNAKGGMRPQNLCKHLFDWDTIHYAHILLCFVAVVNIVHGVSTLFLGVWQVSSFKRAKVWKEDGRARTDINGEPIRVDKESVEAEAPKLLPLSQKLQKDLRYRIASNRWWLWWSIKRQFQIIGPDSLVTRDLYRAARQCCLQYLNTITYRKFPDGTIEYADTRVSNPFKQLLQQHRQGGGPHVEVQHHHDDLAAAGKLHTVHLTKAQLPFVYLATQCLQYNFCKATNADVLLPLMLGVAFLLHPTATQVVITLLVWTMVVVTWVLGMKLQWILLHMAKRYHTQLAREDIRRRYRNLYQKWKQAKAEGFDVDNGDYLRHLQATGQRSVAHSSVPLSSPVHTHSTTNRPNVLARVRSRLFGPQKQYHQYSSTGALPHDSMQHIVDQTQSKVKKRAVDYWTTPTPDTSSLFWFQWPGLVRVLIQVAYYTNSLVVALFLFSSWKARDAITKHAWFWFLNGAGLVHNFGHLSWMVVPAFAVVSTTGRHTPMEVVGEVQRMAVFSHLLVAVRAKHRLDATGMVWHSSRYVAGDRGSSGKDQGAAGLAGELGRR